MSLLWRRALACFVIAAVALVAALAAMNARVETASAPFLVSAEKAPEAEAIVVLGARVYSETSVSPMLHDRLETGLALYEAGKAPKIIVSGDNGQAHYDEVNAMKRFLLDRGVPPEDIFMDHAGFSTYESMYRARDVFGVRKAIVVTQGYHLKRAVYVGRALGIDAFGVASDPREYVGAARYEAREKLARAKDFLLVHTTQPKPKFLGEPFPITGDGRATHD
ncbi:SanA/YdcF family protein [Paenibacillus sp.]|uniref:SanA/YdcF family protein n=1 Tax=Paenibacillus sp. TaxID=58172 RepID=UPI002D5929FA|nr:ElyC/SanA/YdcF family protein [Paenibacillus sp.]HZG58789.1 ElyC/SanA/YdcF family protein [Paenibacillus sp.]